MPNSESEAQAVFDGPGWWLWMGRGPSAVRTRPTDEAVRARPTDDDWIVSTEDRLGRQLWRSRFGWLLLSDAWYTQAGRPTRTRNRSLWDVSWKESRHEVRQEVTGASEIEVLLPELSRDERAWASVKFEQTPCPTRAAVLRHCGELCRGPSLHLKGLLFIAHASRLSWYIGRAPWRGPEGTGSSSSCYGLLDLDSAAHASGRLWCAI